MLKLVLGSVLNVEDLEGSNPVVPKAQVSGESGIPLSVSQLKPFCATHVSELVEMRVGSGSWRDGCLPACVDDQGEGLSANGGIQ